MKRRSLAVRVLTGAVIWVVLALGVGGFAVLQVFQASALRQFDQRIGDELALLSVGIARAPGNPAELMTSPSFARIYSGLYWQAQTASDVFRSRSLWKQSLPLDDVGAREVAGPDGQTLRLLTRRINTPDGTAWLIGVAADLSVLQKETAQFRRGLLPAAAALALALMFAALLVLRTALRPLGQLRAAVQEIQAGSAKVPGRAAEAKDAAETKFPADAFPAEVAPLVQDLRTMLDKHARLSERGRAQAANLAHALKTPAAVLQNEIDRTAAGGEFDLTLAGDAVNRINAAAARHMSAATGPETLPPGQSFDAVALLREIVGAVERLYPEKKISIDAPETIPARVAPSDQQEIYGNLIENAGKWAQSRIDVSLRNDLRGIVLTVADDGPGIPEAEWSRVLRQGVRLDQQVPGSGLGLSIVDDIVARYGGEITLGTAKMGGLLVEVRIPFAD
ncbi:MAG: sensor histidine kinase [Pseudomonadota bacterium]